MRFQVPIWGTVNIDWASNWAKKMRSQQRHSFLKQHVFFIGRSPPQKKTLTYDLTRQGFRLPTHPSSKTTGLSSPNTTGLRTSQSWNGATKWEPKLAISLQALGGFGLSNTSYDRKSRWRNDLVPMICSELTKNHRSRNELFDHADAASWDFPAQHFNGQVVWWTSGRTNQLKTAQTSQKQQNQQICGYRTKGYPTPKVDVFCDFGAMFGIEADGRNHYRDVRFNHSTPDPLDVLKLCGPTKQKSSKTCMSIFNFLTAIQYLERINRLYPFIICSKIFPSCSNLKPSCQQHPHNWKHSGHQWGVWTQPQFVGTLGWARSKLPFKHYATKLSVSQIWPSICIFVSI